ncbi:Nardilysin [Holothuria leucospilota]|uniref:Nardilysin n=1 Tax=Holothuria leucospilota TaxID=206669 RepID=A0A9Q0Y9B4_HOLLE|nr:Nardilysin [Holothuria leucospilota]
MGSEKYPDENSFDMFIKKHGGSDNASTDCERVKFQMSMPSDTYRKAQLLSSMSKDNHPMGKFMWGNTESIKTKPSLNGINVYERLGDFREKNYSSHYMTLVVQSQGRVIVLRNLMILVTQS